jgi:hypothetical protein
MRSTLPSLENGPAGDGYHNSREESEISSSPIHTTLSPPDRESQPSTNLRFTEGGTSIISRSSSIGVQRSFPSEGLCAFFWKHAPWSGWEVISELYHRDSSAGNLWLVYFFTFCANEVCLFYFYFIFTHFIFN